MKKKAVFPGSFDPFTEAHKELCIEASRFFDITILICGNPNKDGGMFDLNTRKNIILDFVGEDSEGVEVVIWNGLVSDYCDKYDIKYVIRGIQYKNAAEELDLSNIYYEESKLRTVFFPTYKPQNQYVSSTRVREHILKGNSTWQQFVPFPCVDRISKYIQNKENRKDCNYCSSK